MSAAVLGNRHEAISRVPYSARSPAGADVINSWDRCARQNVPLSVKPTQAECISSKDEPSVQQQGSLFSHDQGKHTMIGWILDFAPIHLQMFHFRFKCY